MLSIQPAKRSKEAFRKASLGTTALRATTWSVTAAFVLVLVIPAVFKAIKLLYWRTDVGFFASMQTFTGDFIVASGLAGLMSVFCWLWGAGRWGRWIYWVASGTFVALVLGLSVLEHQVWIRTSTLIDWSILSYTLRHYDELAGVVASESNWQGQALLIGAASLAFVPLAVDAFATLAIRRATPPTKGKIGFFFSVFAFFTATSFVFSAPAELQALCKPVAISLMAEALTSDETAIRAQDPAVEIPPDQSVRMVRQALDGAEIKRGNRKVYAKNILFVLLESTRFDASSVYFPELRTTPRQEELAATAAVVQRAYVDIPHTSKALISLFCGFAPRFSFEINESQIGGIPRPCLAHVLARLGFRTGFFQSATGTFENRGQLVENAGYETFMAQESYPHDRFEKTNYLATEDKVMVQPVLEWIDKDPSRPFFVTILTGSTHHKYDTPNNFTKLNLARNFTGRAPIPASSRGYFAQYLNAVRYTDEMLGGIVDGLKARGLLEQTLVVVVGDHGQGFEEHGPKFHNDVIYEEGIRVPLIFSNTRLFPEKRWITGLRRQVDIAPTILSLLNIEYPDSLFEGRDIFTTPGHDRVYTTCWYDRRCMSEIEDNLKVIYHFEQKSMEVFDISVDPLEQVNLIRDGADRIRYKRIAEQAKQRIEAHLAEMQDRFMIVKGERPWLLIREPKPQYPLPVRAEDAFELIGFDAPTLEAQPGKMWEANLYFKCLKPSEPGWRLFYRLQTVDQRSVQTDYFPANARFDLSECSPGTIVVDQLRVWIPEDFPPGPTSLFWGSVYLKHRGPKHYTNPRLKWRKLIPRKRGILIRSRGVLLARIEVQEIYRPDLANLLKQSILTNTPQISQPQGVRFGDDLVLEDFEIEPTRVDQTGSVRVSTLWRVTGEIRGPWRFFTHLYEKKTGKYVGESSSTPIQGLHPIANWRAGTWIKDSFVVELSRRIPSGNIDLWFGIYHDDARMSITDPGKAVADPTNRVLLGTVYVVR
ncbi:MAG: sulfatase-like hydrolase/transferase [Deltaproteobacteria bacterium]|nr:sulfatase-like hydrolase/transferase [Deltaproteobacteria bacterium]